jgi:cytochrome oxidase Cu insertion factor (SCO1/SenC/PrrC family)
MPVSSDALTKIKEPLMKKIGIVLIIVCCLVVAAPYKSSGTPEDLMSAAGVQVFKQELKAPGFDLPDLTGKTVSLKNFQGKAVMLFFYATW